MPVLAPTVPPLDETLEVTAVQGGRLEVVVLELQVLVTALTGTPVTLATNGKLSPVPTVNDAGATETCTPDTILTVAVVLSFVPPTMAVTVTVAGLGTVAGAVYKPLLLIVPTVVFPPDTELTSQTTALVEPVTAGTN